MLILKILVSLLLLSALITIHEFGHFIVAKLMKVRVNEFAIGMGPQLVKWGKGETVYSIRAFPIGGFCAMEGEDEGAPTPAAIGGNGGRSEDPADAVQTEDAAVATEKKKSVSGSLNEKHVWQRILIVIAGAVMNLLLGYILLVIFNGFLLDPYDEDGTVLLGTTTIARIEETSPAYKTGLRPGDTILEVNGRRMLLTDDLNMEMQNDADGVLDMVVRREVNGSKEKVHLDGVTFEKVVDEETGRQFLKYDFAFLGVERTFGNTFVYAAKQELSMATMVWRSLIDMLSGRYGLNELSGPVGTVDVISNVVSEANSLAGVRTLVYLIVMITVNLGVFNLLPLPALDGGRLVFLLWEGITRRPVPPKYEGIVHLVGLALLLLLSLVITYSDITKIFAR